MDEEGFIGLWDTDGVSFFVQVLGRTNAVLQRRLGGSGTDPTEGVGKVGMTGKSFFGGGGLQYNMEEMEHVL